MSKRKRNKMKAEELRIGNLILDDCGLPATLDSIEKSWNERNETYYMFYDDTMAENLNPTAIPLTKEWLVKFGFKSKRYKHKVIWTNQINAVKVFRCVMNDKHFFKAETGYDIRFSPILESVHQLQNLYFALTNKELKLKQND